jgi:regulator of replication initiation timing
MNQEIPEEFKNKDREELYVDIIMLSNYINKLKNEIEEYKAQLHLKSGEMIKKRSENFQLKSQIGLQNIKINDLNQEKNNIIDIELISGSL